MYQPSQFGPEYGVEEALIINIKALGFEDVSWGNNGCPSFHRERPNGEDCELQVTVWVDAKVAADREYPLTKRFMLDVREEKRTGGRNDCIIETDDFWELIRHARATLVREGFHVPLPDDSFGISRVDLAACYVALIGCDPFEDNPSILPAEVAQILVDYLQDRLIEECF